MRRLATCLCAILIAVTLAAAIPAHAENAVVRSFQQAAISPDGTHVAWVQDSDSEGGTSIYVQDLNSSNSKPRRISAGTGDSLSEDQVAWSPDSKRIAFLSDAESRDQAELYVAAIDGNSTRKLTSVSGALADPGWSPDGKAIAFLFTENAPRANPLMPMAPETGLIAEKVYEQRLTVLDVGSSKLQEISPPDMYVYEYDWSPDSKSFALLSAHGAGDANWYVAQLYTMNANGGQLTPIHKPQLQIAEPRWSPDGKTIAFIEGLMSDEGVIGGDIFVVPANGGSGHDLTPGIESSPSALHWQTQSTIVFAENIDGGVGVSTIEIVNGKISQLWKGPGAVKNATFAATNISLAADGQSSAAIFNSSDHPPEIMVGPIGQWRQITHANQNVHADWGEIKSIRWTSDRMSIQGWLMYPKPYDASRQYPLIVVAHGGPAGAAEAAWPYRFFNTYELSAHGYFVLYPNPRGSFGEGEKFTQGNVKDFGYGDLRDILAGVDEVERTMPIDKNRVGFTGWSYGGFMTMWVVTQTHRFRAAMAGAGIADWLSYYGENDIDEWMPPYFGASVYDDPAVYAKSAPINFIKNVKTPTLVLVGERDGECPAPQSREFWHALKTFDVNTELVIYPGEGHSFIQPDHQRDVMDRTIAWFDRYLK
jgi:dipeptidyl aminopeptidase/acylaminoacyl peptidase